MMESLTLPTLLGVLANFGFAGIVLLIWWQDNKTIRKMHADHKAEI